MVRKGCIARSSLICVHLQHLRMRFYPQITQMYADGNHLSRIPSSSNCFSSTRDGASLSRSCARAVFGIALDFVDVFEPRRRERMMAREETAALFVPLEEWEVDDPQEVPPIGWDQSPLLAELQTQGSENVPHDRVPATRDYQHGVLLARAECLEERLVVRGRERLERRKFRDHFEVALLVAELCGVVLDRIELLAGQLFAAGDDDCADGS